MELPYSNLKIRHWNPGATMPLILPVHVICNTSDEAIYNNIRINSHDQHPWLKLSEPHDRVAILCGSGPSLADHQGEIRERASAGQIVFAMNGSARFLADNGIMPKYQVILDARLETADLIGPADAHLFASQVHPECFRRKPDAMLWHLQVQGIDDLIPANRGAFCLIGGAASVGNTTTCVAYAMGYRALHLYGYDSSNRDDATHAFTQSMNDGDPMCAVDFNGKEYICSLTMKLQAERFMTTGRALEEAGCRIEVHGDGLLPAMWRAPPEVLSEADKYTRLWKTETYRQHSPGALLVDLFMEMVQPRGRVIDFGCGTGRAGLEISRRGIEVVLVDFAVNCRDGEAAHLPFIQADLTKEIPITGDHGYCTDVLEHLSEETLPAAVRNMLAAAPELFCQVSTVHDRLGTLVGQTLHLTVKPADWWNALFLGLGYTVLWRDTLPEAALFHLKRSEAA